ncbi:MAG: CPBP family glutamic-type intramembrane protease [Erythrobacter sp.]
MSDMPTRPVTSHATNTEIDTVFGDGRPLEPAASIAAEWQGAFAFLGRPSLALKGTSAQPFTLLARIYALDIALMLLLIGVAGIATTLGVELPETAIAGMEFTPGLIALVIIGAPLLEELIFRGWLTGRPGELTALALALGVGGIALVTSGIEGAIIWTAGAAVLACLAAIVLLIIWRARPAPHWYGRNFPAFFWLSTLGFALIHIANFGDAPLLAVLPLVVPQFVIGALLGYVRVRIGLWAAILLHAAHNAIALAIASLTMGTSA